MLPGANLARLAASQGWDFILIDTVSSEAKENRLMTLNVRWHIGTREYR